MFSSSYLTNFYNTMNEHFTCIFLFIIYLIEGRKPCVPKITLCKRSDIEAPKCRNGRYWARKWKEPRWERALGWIISTPLNTGVDKTNCCFVLYEKSGRSYDGRVIAVQPGSKKQIEWDLRSLELTRFSACPQI